MTTFIPSARRLAGVALTLVLVGLTGCGPALVPVSGKVEYRGKPVTSGGVTLFAADGSVYSGPIAADGTFAIAAAAPGPVKVGVSSPNPNRAGPTRGPRPGVDASKRSGEKGTAPPAPPADGWFALDAKFADPATSGLTGEVRKGQPLDIDVK